MSGDEGLEEELGADEELGHDDLFGEGQEIEENAGSQAIAGRTLEAQDQKMYQKYVLEKERRKAAWKKLSFKQKLLRIFVSPVRFPFNHYKKNFKKVALVTLVGGGAALGIAVAAAVTMGTSLALLPVYCTLPLAYPLYAIPEKSLSTAGYWIGHFLNGLAKKGGSYRHLKTEPAGLWGGRLLGAALVISGGIFGETYLKGAAKAIVNAPEFIVRDVPDFIIDQRPKFRNTWIDPKWEAADQPGALWQDQVNPDRKLLWLFPLKAHYNEAGKKGEGIEIIVPDRFLPVVEATPDTETPVDIEITEPAVTDDTAPAKIEATEPAVTEETVPAEIEKVSAPVVPTPSVPAPF